jgi:hypothetical protein
MKLIILSSALAYVLALDTHAANGIHQNSSFLSADRTHENPGTPSSHQNLGAPSANGIHQSPGMPFQVNSSDIHPMAFGNFGRNIMSPFGSNNTLYKNSFFPMGRLLNQRSWSNNSFPINVYRAKLALLNRSRNMHNGIMGFMNGTFAGNNSSNVLQHFPINAYRARMSLLNRLHNMQLNQTLANHTASPIVTKRNTSSLNNHTPSVPVLENVTQAALKHKTLKTNNNSIHVSNSTLAHDGQSSDTTNTHSSFETVAKNTPLHTQVAKNTVSNSTSTPNCSSCNKNVGAASHPPTPLPDLHNQDVGHNSTNTATKNTNTIHSTPTACTNHCATPEANKESEIDESNTSSEVTDDAKNHTSQSSSHDAKTALPKKVELI